MLLSSPFRIPPGESAWVIVDVEADDDAELSAGVLGEGFELPPTERIPAPKSAGRCRINIPVGFRSNLPDTRGCLVLRTLPGYTGRIAIHGVRVSKEPGGPPLLLVEEAGLRGDVFARAGDSLTVFARVRNWGGETAGEVTPQVGAAVPLEATGIGDKGPEDLAPGEVAEWSWKVRCPDAGDFVFRVGFESGHGEEAEIPLRFHERPEFVHMGRIPEPEPAPTDYEVGVYYFPRWFERKNWEVLLPFPGRKPLLGWYVDLSPDVADWHTNWCRAAGISFFIYDWYWEDGRRQLYGALEDGFLQSRYRSDLRFCLLWANHNRPNTHSLEDFLEVTRFWIDRYFRLPEYYTIDGRPVVVIFAPHNIVRDLGGEDAVREAFDAIREECRKAGVAPAYLVACGGGDEKTQRGFAAQGYDASSGYNYPGISGADTDGEGYAAQIEGYRELWRDAVEPDVLPHIPVLSGGWDSRPWHGAKALVRAGRTPEIFERHCRDAKGFLDGVSPRNRKVLFVEAWNEWGEGSYIEPHAEFGFGYLRAIREVFTKAEDGWQPLLPKDVGLSVPLVPGVDLPPVEAAYPASWSVVIPAGEWDIGGTRFRVKEPLVLEVEPEPVLQASESLVLSDEQPEKWKGGTTLSGTVGPYTSTRLPLAIDPASVTVRRGKTEDAVVYREGVDYVFEPEYGGIARKPGGPIPEKAEVTIDYRHYLARIDGVDILADGSAAVTEGEPAKACPLPPEDIPGAVRIAHLWVPFRTESITEGNIYLIPPGGTGRVSDVPIYHTGSPFLAPVRDKLAQGGPVTVVCLGDSVTVGGNATSQERNFVGLFGAGLRERYPEAEIRVINAGVGGTNSDFGLERLDRDVLVHKPDLVVVEFVNDMGFRSDKIRRNYDALIERIRAEGGEILLLTPHFTRSVWMSERFHEAAQALRDVAYEQRVALGDVTASWAAMSRVGVPYEALLANGINHPDDRGHRLYADTLLAFFDRE